MTYFISEVISICSADGWVCCFDDGVKFPVMCFALVSAKNRDDEDDVLLRQIIGITELEIFLDLVGLEIKSHMTAFDRSNRSTY